MLFCAFLGNKNSSLHTTPFTQLYLIDMLQSGNNTYFLLRMLSIFYHTYSLHRQVRCSVWQIQPNSAQFFVCNAGNMPAFLIKRADNTSCLSSLSHMVLTKLSTVGSPQAALLKPKLLNE